MVESDIEDGIATDSMKSIKEEEKKMKEQRR